MSIDFFQKHISQTEWFEAMNHGNTVVLRDEDNKKRDRLEILYQSIGLPYDKPYKFSATDVETQTPEFTEFLSSHGDELCAMRLVPLDPTLPKLRTRGDSIRNSLSWFKDQHIDAINYLVEFVPHSEKTLWSTIFIVNSHGIFGQIIANSLDHLSQGYFTTEEPITFSFDFTDWQSSTQNQEAKEHILMLTKLLQVNDEQIQQKLRQELNAEFAHNYLCGYFETVLTDEGQLWFVDYNRLLGKLYQDFSVSVQTTTSSPTLLQGSPGCRGQARGHVRIVHKEDIASTTLQPNDILVCSMTSPEYVPLMKQAAAIITDQGGILSHAVIVSRELQKPCVVGTKSATTNLKNGDFIEVDGDTGTVRHLSMSA